MRRFAGGKKRMLLLGAAVSAVAAAVLAVTVSSCRREKRLETFRPLRLAGVPAIRVRLSPGAVDSAEISATGHCRVTVGERTVLDAPHGLKPTSVALSGRTWRLGDLTAEGQDVEIFTSFDGAIRWGRTEYRGRLRLVATETRQFVAINHLDMESYLAGVLRKELYGSWSLDTYRALAVAARTFALYQISRFGTSRAFDLWDSQMSQVYGGLTAETPKSWQAVQDTHGQVLAWGPAGREEIFLAQYSACCGGTVNDAAVLRNASEIPPLRGGQQCDDCSACSRYRWPPVRVYKQELLDALAIWDEQILKLHGLASIQVAERTSYGRPLRVDVVGSRGRRVRVRYDDLRGVLIRTGAASKLYSMNCRIRDLGDEIEFYDGKGFGHGVGLCQWGAEGKARKGWSGRQILAFYYPGAAIIAAY